jgi:hypothetical protein
VVLFRFRSWCCIHLSGRSVGCCGCMALWNLCGLLIWRLLVLREGWRLGVGCGVGPNGVEPQHDIRAKEKAAGKMEGTYARWRATSTERISLEGCGKILLYTFAVVASLVVRHVCALGVESTIPVTEHPACYWLVWGEGGGQGGFINACHNTFQPRREIAPASNRQQTSRAKHSPE